MRSKIQDQEFDHAEPGAGGENGEGHAVSQLFARLITMTYIWQIHDSYPELMIGEYDRKNGHGRFLLKKGQRLGDEIGPWRFTFQALVANLRKLDDLANNTLVPLISPRLAKLVLAITDQDAQLLPVEIDASDGTIREYRLLNVLAQLPAVDRSVSEFSLIPGSNEVMKFRKLVLLEGCLGDHQLARCKEYSSYLLVSDKMASPMLDSQMAGMQMTLPQNIKP